MKNTLSILIVLLSTTVSMAQIPTYVPTNGLQAWYPFDGNANDESGNSNNGTVNGATLTIDRFGNSNSAYSFDGVDDFISLGNDVFDDSEGTIVFWFNPVDMIDDRPIFSAGVQNNNYNGMKVLLKGSGSPSDRLQYTHDKRDCQTLSTGLGIKVTEEVPTLNTWQFGAVVVDEDSTYLYLNCLNEDSITVNATKVNGNWFADLCSGTHATFIGRFLRPLGDDYFYGNLDDIGVWNRALEPCEIQQLCSSGQGGISTAITTSGSTTFCQGGEVELSAPAGYDYLWSNNETTQSIVVNSTGTYSVEVIDGACSETSQDVSVTVLSNPSVSLGAFSAICENASAITLNGGSPAGGSYTVNGNPATELDPSVTGSGMQTIEYSYTDQNNCTGNASQTVMVNSIPSVTLSGLNASYSLSDNPSVLTGTPSGGFFNGTGVANGTFDPAVAGLGTHGVSYAVVDGNGCVGVSSLCTTVDVNVGIGDGSQISNGGGIDVYPNPTNGQFNLTVDDVIGVVSYTVYDVRGREVLNGSFVSNGNHTEVLDLSNSADGVYSVQLNTSNGVATQKLIKE